MLQSVYTCGYLFNFRSSSDGSSSKSKDRDHSSSSKSGSSSSKSSSSSSSRYGHWTQIFIFVTFFKKYSQRLSVILVATSVCHYKQMQGNFSSQMSESVEGNEESSVFSVYLCSWESEYLNLQKWPILSTSSKHRGSSKERSSSSSSSKDPSRHSSSGKHIFVQRRNI